MPKIIGNGAPTSQTPGTLGQEYFDKDSNTVYTCIKAEHKTEGTDFVGDYEWAVLGGSSYDLVLEISTDIIDGTSVYNTKIVKGSMAQVRQAVIEGRMPTGSVRFNDHGEVTEYGVYGSYSEGPASFQCYGDYIWVEAILPNVGSTPRIYRVTFNGSGEIDTTTFVLLSTAE